MHGHEVRFMIIADGQMWTDSDGSTEWSLFDVASLAELVEGLGYDIQVIPA